MYWLGTLTAGMTAFYVFRAMFLAFFGEYRGDKHAHESPPVMLIPLAILALLSLAGGSFSKSRVPGADLPPRSKRPRIPPWWPSRWRRA
jgi:NADH:ubiquinone oxidoreductase subunit 5 (subunit L)/multisubunit Na+/H+ antiporter MnhA subunit